MDGAETATASVKPAKREYVNYVFWCNQEIGVEEFYEGIIMLTFREGNV